MAEKNDGKGDDGMEVEVTKDLVRQCDDRTRSVAQHWRLLGELLKVETSHLNEIQRMYQESDQKKEMLRYWLKFKQGSVNSDKKLNDALAQIQNKFPDLQGKNASSILSDTDTTKISHSLSLILFEQTGITQIKWTTISKKISDS